MALIKALAASAFRQLVVCSFSTKIRAGGRVVAIGAGESGTFGLDRA
ncbi:hypothetical protein [Paenibacillus sp. UNC496MF]|nr:hypothetical protein [Paenibacillus sp. UNC496MF]